MGKDGKKIAQLSFHKPLKLQGILFEQQNTLPKVKLDVPCDVRRVHKELNKKFINACEKGKQPNFNSTKLIIKKNTFEYDPLSLVTVISLAIGLGD